MNIVPGCFFCKRLKLGEAQATIDFKSLATLDGGSLIAQDGPESIITFHFPESSNGIANTGHGTVVDEVPCQQCEMCMSHGIVLISVLDGEIEKVNAMAKQYEQALSGLNEKARAHARKFIADPKRSGLWVAVTEDWIMSNVKDSSAAYNMIASRWSFIPDSRVRGLGLDQEANYTWNEESSTWEKKSKIIQP